MNLTTLDPRMLRSAFSRFATGVTVVSYEHEGEPRGITVNSFTSVSLTPALALVSIAERAASAARMKGGRFAINVLREDQHSHALQFSGRAQEGFDAEWVRQPDAAPELGAALAVFQCSTWKVVPAGDHDLFLGEISSVRYADEARPLLFVNGQFASIGGPLQLAG